MKVKLSVFILCICSMVLFAGCKQNGNQQNDSTVTLSQPLQQFIDKKYPEAKVLSVDKEKNGTEVDILDKDIKKEVWFDTTGQWVSTQWNIKAHEVPVAIMDALIYSAYNQYKVEDITLIEKATDTFYEFEMKQDNNEVRVVFDSMAQVVVQ